MSLFLYTLVCALLCSSTVLSYTKTEEDPLSLFGGPTKISFNIPGIKESTVTVTETHYVEIMTEPQSSDCLTDYLDYCGPPQTVTKPPVTLTQPAITVTKASKVIVTTTLAAVPCPIDLSNTSYTVSSNRSVHNYSSKAEEIALSVTELVQNYPMITASLVVILALTVCSCCLVLTAIKCSQVRKNARQAARLTRERSGDILKNQRKRKKGPARSNSSPSISNPLAGSFMTAGNFHETPKLPERNCAAKPSELEMNALTALQRKAANEALGATPKYYGSTLLNENAAYNQVETDNDYVEPNNEPPIYKGALGGGII